jgi:uncharacterized lipoprotein NlpE involved in copper resistance
MNKKTFIIFLLMAVFAIFGLSSCRSNGKVVDIHNARISLDWTGVYTGTIPAADGPGINVRLKLNIDQSYELQYKYIDRPNSLYNWTGSFQWDNKGNTVILDLKDGPPYYKVVQNALIQMDMKGNQIKGKLANNYVLKKEL